MREISTEEIKIGEHVLIDGVEYVANKADQDDVCKGCAFRDNESCSDFIVCHGIIFEKVKKEPKYRPYKDTAEMIADLKEHGRNWSAMSMPLIWIKNGNDDKYLITEYFDDSVGLFSCNETLTELFEDYTYLDGSPCGKEVTE